MTRLAVLIAVATWLLMASVVWRALPLAPRDVRRRWTRFFCPRGAAFGFAVDVRIIVVTR